VVGLSNMCDEADKVYLGIYLIVGFTTLIRTPKVGDGLDADLEDEEEEGLLSSTGRRFNAAWSDVTGMLDESLL